MLVAFLFSRGDGVHFGFPRQGSAPFQGLSLCHAPAEKQHHEDTASHIFTPPSHMAETAFLETPSASIHIAATCFPFIQIMEFVCFVFKKPRQTAIFAKNPQIWHFGA